MTLLVIGGAGFIGSFITHELVIRGNEIVVLDNLQTGHREAVHPDAKFIQGDIGDFQLVKQLLIKNRIQAVIHLASNASPTESMKSPFRYMEDEVRNSTHLIRASIECDVSQFLFASTANLFGNLLKKGSIAEDEVVNPATPYGESKRMIEEILRWASKLYGIKHVIFRLFNATGADTCGKLGEDHDPEMHLIPLVMKVALRQIEELQVFGSDYDTPDGTCIRDYVHVYDIARAFAMAIEAIDSCQNKTYHIGSGLGHSVLDVINTAEHVTGRSIPYKVVPRRLGDPNILIADYSQIRADLDWLPIRSELSSILQSAWFWHKENPTGYPR